MKKKYLIPLFLFCCCAGFPSCTKDEPFSTVSADDDPRILDPVFADRGDDGKPAVFYTIDRDANLNVTLTVTPAGYCSTVWYIDGVEVQRGNVIDMNLKAGTYDLKIVVSMENGKSTCREGIVKVNPLDGDPVAVTYNYERIIVPGREAVLYGTDLDKVDRIIIDGRPVKTVFDTDHITYTVPSDIADGTYRISLADAGGFEYGADKLTVTTSPMVTGGYERTTAGAEWTITGVNLDKVVSLQLGDKSITGFVEQTVSGLTVMTPSLADGDYTLSGKDMDGNPLYFYTSDEILTEMTVNISSERVLWKGHHYISWDRPDGDPNKTFNLLGKDVFAAISPNAVMDIHYSIAPDDEYHAIAPTNGQWGTLPGIDRFDPPHDGPSEGVYSVTLSRDALDDIQGKDGFLITGHGVYIDMITVK